MFEIEIKSLLGSKERADALKRRLAERFPALKVLPPHKQRNFYFNTPSDLRIIEKALGVLFSPKKREEFSQIIKTARGGVSVRTRDADGRTLFIIKASIGDDTSANGVSRVEFEEPVPLSFDALNRRLLGAGLTYQAKWSREREAYDLGGVQVTVDKNAGYGYLAEFEKMMQDGAEAEAARREITALMQTLQCEELPQARLERMFAYYNAHWEEYYGTDRTFTVE